MTEIIIRYLHFIGIMGLAGCLVIQHLIISAEVTKEEMKKIAFIDIIYGVSAAITLIAGLLLWFAVGKDSSFYLSNGAFHAKLTMFIVIALLSIYPTMFYLKSKKSLNDTIKMPKVIIMLARMQLLLLFILPFFGAMIAQGVGFN